MGQLMIGWTNSRKIDTVKLNPFGIMHDPINKLKDKYSIIESIVYSILLGKLAQDVFSSVNQGCLLSGHTSSSDPCCPGVLVSTLLTQSTQNNRAVV